MTVLVRPQALDNFKVREFQMLIDGEWTDGAEGGIIERKSPGHGVVVSRYQAGTKGDAERAIAAARNAFDNGPWSRMTGADRSNVLLKAADLIASRSDELAYLDCIESGKPISQAKAELGGAVDIWRYAAALGRDLHGESYNTLGDATLGMVLRDRGRVYRCGETIGADIRLDAGAR
jgi:acyl-CoA reductase-like NAD-dependent aldehyde dehydrogenase